VSAPAGRTRIALVVELDRGEREMSRSNSSNSSGNNNNRRRSRRRRKRR